MPPERPFKSGEEVSQLTLRIPVGSSTEGRCAQAVEGLTEPLFMALLLGSFLAMRKERWAIAALLASGATVVRPIGIFALLALAIVLFRRKAFRELAIATVVGLIIAIVYAIPMILIYGNALANWAGYRKRDWDSAMPVGLPFAALIRGAKTDAYMQSLRHSFHWRPFVWELVTLAWVLLTLVGIGRFLAGKFWRRAGGYPAEAIFAGTYAMFLFSYNTSQWAWNQFIRFAIPLVPFRHRCVSRPAT